MGSIIFLLSNPFMPDVILLTTGQSSTDVLQRFQTSSTPAPFEIDTYIRLKQADAILKTMTAIFQSVQCPLNPLFFRLSLPAVRPLFDLLNLKNTRNTVLYCAFNQGLMLIYRTGLDVIPKDYTHFPVESDFKIVCAKYGTFELLTLIQTFFRKKARNQTSALYNVYPNEILRVFDLLEGDLLPTEKLEKLEWELNRNRVRAHIPKKKPAPSKDQITFFFKTEIKKNK